MTRNWLTLFAFMLVALCGPLASPVAGQTYTAVPLPISPYAINDAGQVAGATGVLLPNGTAANHAVLWQNGAIIDLGTLPGGNGSYANGINNAGQVVGMSTRLSGG